MDKESNPLYISDDELEALQNHLLILSDLDASIQKVLNKYYFGSIAWLDPLVWTFLLMATLVNAVGLLFYPANSAYLLVTTVPVISCFFVSQYVNYLKKKNTLKMLSRNAYVPSRVKTLIKRHLDANLQKYHDLMTFEIDQEMVPLKTKSRILRILDMDSWRVNKLARQNCLYLGYLMINLQIKINQAKKQKRQRKY